VPPQVADRTPHLHVAPPPAAVAIDRALTPPCLAS
jgi:hypothetical protein